MESEKTQEIGLNQSPINDVFKISQLPKNFKYGQKIQYAISEKEMELYPSTGNQTYSQNQNIKFTLSVANDKMRFLYGPGSYLAFQLTIAGQSAALDTTTSCLFCESKTIGANQIEYITEQNILTNILMDQCEPYLRKTYYSFFGNGNAFGVTDATAASQIYALTNATIRDGYILAAGESRYFISLLPSGIWGCWQKNLLPLSEMPLGLQLDLRTETNAVALRHVVTGATYSLGDIRLKMSVIELNEMMSDSVRRIYDNLYIVPFETYSSWQTTINTGVLNGIINIPVNYKYVKAIIIAFRSNNIIGSTVDRSLSTRAKAGLIEYSFSINGQILPQTPIYLANDSELCNNGLFTNGTVTGGDSRGFMQVQKIWNNVPGFNSACSFGNNEFNSTGINVRGAETAIAVAGKGAFFMGLNLESLTSDMDLYRTTTQVSGYNVQFRYRFNQSLGTAPQTANSYLLAHIFLWLEGDMVIENGVANVDL